MTLTDAIPTLTILYHPVLSRIGERVLLTEFMVGRVAKISRAAPLFSATGCDRGAALGESQVSREPFVLRRSQDGAVALDPADTRTPIAIDGVRVTEPVTLLCEAVERGIIIELADRIALLLHLRVPDDRPRQGNMGLLGGSAAIRAVRDDIRRVAALDIPVLIRGETGSGKTLAAHAIHRNSPRSARPFVTVNLAALPSSLIASELFGVARGADTAARGQRGCFRQARGGSLFLDGLGELPMDVQAMLLRAVETQDVFPLGAQQPQSIDVRIIAATNTDLERMTREGRFRAPLLHRLAGYEIHVPALRERREDVAPLLVHFLARELTQLGDSHCLTQTEPTPWLSMSTVLRLLQYEWPGNVRQLCNAARQLGIHNRGREVAELPVSLTRLLDRTHHSELSPAGDRLVEPRDDPTRCYRKPSTIPESELIDSLRAHDWDIKATANALLISRTSLYGLIRASRHMRTAGDLTTEEIRTCFAEFDGDVQAMVGRLCVSAPALRRRIRELKLA